MTPSGETAIRDGARLRAAARELGLAADHLAAAAGKLESRWGWQHTVLSLAGRARKLADRVTDEARQ